MLGVEGSMGEWENEEEQILDKLVVVKSFIKKKKKVVTKRHPELALACQHANCWLKMGCIRTKPSPSMANSHF